jgi:hypothetical protein
VFLTFFVLGVAPFCYISGLKLDSRDKREVGVLRTFSIKLFKVLQCFLDFWCTFRFQEGLLLFKFIFKVGVNFLKIRLDKFFDSFSFFEVIVINFT